MWRDTAGLVLGALRRHVPLVVGVGTSCLLLTLLLVLAGLDAGVLRLEVRWLVLAATPTAIALLVGGYIHSFKGFGVEIEAGVTGPTGSVALEARDATTVTPAMMKETLADLRRRTPEQLRVVQVLVFDVERREFYGTHEVATYLALMRGVRFVLFRRQGRFVCLLPWRSRRMLDERGTRDRADQLVQWLQEGHVEERLAGQAVFESVTTSTPLVDALNVLYANQKGFLPVLDQHGGLVGVLTRAIAESAIAKEVARARLRSRPMA